MKNKYTDYEPPMPDIVIFEEPGTIFEGEFVGLKDTAYGPAIAVVNAQGDKKQLPNLTKFTQSIDDFQEMKGLCDNLMLRIEFLGFIKTPNGKMKDFKISTQMVSQDTI